MRDAEGLFRGLVAAALPGIRVATKVPATLPAEFVWVRRTGGPSMGRVVDMPQMAVTAWAADSVRAERLADLARQAFLDAPLGSNGVHSVDISSFYYDPDPDSRKDRYTFNAFTNVRAARS